MTFQHHQDNEKSPFTRREYCLYLLQADVLHINLHYHGIDRNFNGEIRFLVSL